MEVAESAFKELLRKGLRGEEPDNSLFENLTGEDWEAIYHIAKRQTVCGICYDSFCRLPDRLLPPGSLLPRWVARVNAIETRNIEMRCALTELISVFRKAGLHPIVQKGLSVARFYVNPESRESGDIDLWLPGEELSTGFDIISKLNCIPVTHPDGSISFSYKGFIVEFHRTLISISNPMLSDRLDSYTLVLCKKLGYTDTGIPSPPPLLELLLLDVHIMRHAFGNGIGMRQICDYVIASKSLNDSYDRRVFENCCRILGISKWTALLNRFAESYLDADPTNLPPSGWTGKKELPVSKLHDIISSGGNFGQHLKKYSLNSGKSAKTKFHTLTMLARRSQFAASIAPTEAFWNFIRLLVGQIH